MCLEKRRSKHTRLSRSRILMGANPGISSPTTLRTEAGLVLQLSQVGPTSIPGIDSDPSLAMTKLRKEHKGQSHKDGLPTEW